MGFFLNSALSQSRKATKSYHRLLKISFINIADYTKAIELDPNYALAYYNRGMLKGDLNDHNVAVADYNKLIEIDPNDSDAYTNRSYYKRQLKDYYGSISDGMRAIEINPNEVNAYINIGTSKKQLGDINGACAAWKKAAALGNKYAAKWVESECY